MEDQQMIELFLLRSEDAIRAVSEKYGRICLSISRGILSNEEDAKECVNDAYLALWNTIPPEKPDPLSAYLFRVVRNISLRKYRYNTAEKRNTHYDVALEELVECLQGAENVEQFVEHQELADYLNRFLEKQKDRDRILFVKRYFFAAEPRELAAQMGLSVNSVNVSLHRTRKRFRDYLRKEHFYE